MKNLLVMIILFCNYACSGQDIKIIEEKLISKNIDFPLNEPHFIIDPNDANHYIVASILGNVWKKGETANWREGQAADSHIVLLQSWDAGKTWEEKHFNDHDIASGYDPWLSMNADGTLILTSLNTLKSQRFLHFLVFISRDGGKTWLDNPINLGTSHDRQSIVVHPTHQKFIIVSSRFNRSSDNRGLRGLSVTVLSRWGHFLESNFHSIFNLNKVNGTPLITKNKELLIPFTDFSSDRFGKVDTRRHWLVKSTDLGRTFLDPIVISENTSFPHVLIDTTNYDTDIVYQLHKNSVSRDFTAGYRASTSKDYGYSWSEQSDITQHEGDNAYIRNADWILNNEGTIGAFWFDRRGVDAKSHNLYFSYSNDQGKSFKKPTRVSSKTSTPDKDKYMNDDRWPVGGDYFGIATSDNGDFKVVWADHRTDKTQLYLATIRVEQ